MQLGVALGFNNIKVSPCEALQSSPKVNLERNSIDYGQPATGAVRMGECGEKQSRKGWKNERGKNKNGTLSRIYPTSLWLPSPLTQNPFSSH